VAATVRSILLTGYRAYAQTHPVARYRRRVMRDIRRCRTGDLGVFVRRCPAGHFAEVSGCSCRNRSCPTCSPARRTRWLEAWSRRLLPGLHLHTILTMPGELHPLWRHNRYRMARLLFAVAHRTMTILTDDPRHLGARPGMLMALHTWSRALSLHPHVHIIVTGGGLGGDGHWKPLTRRDFLAPVDRLKAIYRDELLAALREACRDDKLRPPPGADMQQVDRLLRHLESIKWNVRIEPPYRHGHGVTNYLARYVMGGPIGNGRIKHFDGKQVEVVVGRERKDPATVKLSTEEFIGRWLEHVPVSGFHIVRAYGLYSSAMAAKREACRAELAAAGPPATAEDSIDDNEQAPARPQCCPVCDRTLVIEDSRIRRRRPSWLPLIRGPDPWWLAQAA